MNSPILTFNSDTAPYAILTSPIAYSETVATYPGLPILQGDNSDTRYFRIYNNYNVPPASNIATAYNLSLTSFDGVGAASHTATKSAVFQEWLYLQQYGFGEYSSIPGLYTLYADASNGPVAIGGSSNIYVPYFGSNGSNPAVIRAWSNNAGVGFLRIKSYLSIPLGTSTTSGTIGMTIFYDWNS